MTYDLHLGDCLEILKTLPDNSVDAVVSDPPYGLSDHSLADTMACLQAWLAGEEYRPKKKGFMGRSWDAWVPGPEVWREVLRVLKPGGHLLAFAGTRSMDLMSMAVRLAGFELRDGIGYAHDGSGAPLMAWVYGSGFPKSMDVSKAIDKAAGAEREIVGSKLGQPGYSLKQNDTDEHGRKVYGKFTDAEAECAITAPATDAARQWAGWGTALKPAWEPIIIARKPMIGTVAENVLAHGTGALNIDGCRVGRPDGKAPEIGTPGWGGPAKKLTAVPGQVGATVERAAPHQAGRFPANLIHDGSPEVVALFPDSNGSCGSVPNVKITGYGDKNVGTGKSEYFGGERAKHNAGSGSAARFFYAAKASKKDRGEGNHHPTVKPTDLMRYLCRLVTPPGGVVLDPFMGSGTTGKAAMREGFRFIGCEMSPEYIAIANARIARAFEEFLGDLA